MKDKGSFSIKIIFFEIFSVAVGITLGFIVNEWREDLAKEKKAEVAFERILTEVEANTALLRIRHPYYKALLDSAEKLTTNDEIDLRDLDIWQGTNPPLFTESAYSVALSTGTLDYMNAELAASITELYASLKSFSEFSQFSVANTLLIDENAAPLFFHRTIAFYEEYSRICFARYDNLQAFLTNNN